jgi:hypothetical protein
MARARQAQWADVWSAVRLAEIGLRTPRAGAHTRALCAVRAAVLWNWYAPALWNRFVIEPVRVLAASVGLSERAFRELVRVAYVKAAEFQARGLVHFHAIIRLDDPADRGLPPASTDATARQTRVDPAAG